MSSGLANLTNFAVCSVVPASAAHLLVLLFLDLAGLRRRLPDTCEDVLRHLVVGKRAGLPLLSELVLLALALLQLRGELLEVNLTVVDFPPVLRRFSWVFPQCFEG